MKPGGHADVAPPAAVRMPSTWKTPVTPPMTATSSDVRRSASGTRRMVIQRWTRKNAAGTAAAMVTLGCTAVRPTPASAVATTRPLVGAASTRQSKASNAGMSATPAVNGNSGPQVSVSYGNYVNAQAKMPVEAVSAGILVTSATSTEIDRLNNPIWNPLLTSSTCGIGQPPICATVASST